jgi:hypothetical protein
MRLLCSWAFVNLGALLAALFASVLWPASPKAAAEGLGWELIFPTMVGGLCWFLLALIRFTARQHSDRQ